MMNEQQLFYALALWRTPGIGPSTFKFLQEKVRDLAYLFKASSTELQTLGVSKPIISALKQISWKDVDLDMQWQKQRANRFILTMQHVHYPRLLREISSAPPLLFIEGDLARLSQKQIAMVGSRHASHLGAQTANQFACALAERGLVITSGLAYGIDKASHEGALRAKSGTIAVLGTGLERIYPRQHQALAEKITENGALVSEFPIGTLPKASHFPRRNRVISGLSAGVLVIEAALESGSLITAQYALEQNRDVFAIPGSIHNPLARGCHRLIRQGAKLVETVDDILEELGPWIGQKPVENSTSQNEDSPDNIEQKTLLACIDLAPTPIDLLIERSKLAADIVAANLLLLEVEGYVQKTPEGYLKR